MTEESIAVDRIQPLARKIVQDELPLEVAIDVHRDLSHIELASFRHVQVVVHPMGERNRIRFIPEACCVVTGDAAVPVATADQLMRDTLAVWQHTKFEVAEFLAPEPAIGSPLRRWMDTVTHHYGSGETTSTALEAIRAGAAFLEAASEWCRRSTS